MKSLMRSVCYPLECPQFALITDGQVLNHKWFGSEFQADSLA